VLNLFRNGVRGHSSNYRAKTVQSAEIEVSESAISRLTIELAIFEAFVFRSNLSSHPSMAIKSIRSRWNAIQSRAGTIV
jgi:hypothetical protein